jgi:release factor glutamine methyltransferase
LEAPAILDLGTGSGCIAIAAAHQLPKAQVTAVDQSARALAIARENAVQNKVADRVRFVEGDLFATLEPGTRFDIIASNPPYVADDEMSTLPPDVRDHEPASALKAGPKGLDVLQRIIEAAPDWLKPGGVLLLEFSPEQAPDLTALLENRGFTSVKLLKDPAGRLRVARAIWSAAA